MFKFCFAHQGTSLFQKFGFIGGLDPSDHFLGNNWVQNGLSAITLEPHVQFSQTTPYFVRNFVSHTKLPVYFRYLALLGTWNLVRDHFWGNWAKNRLSDVTLEPHIQFSQTTPYFVRNFVSHTKLPVYFRYLALLGTWNLVRDHFWGNWAKNRLSDVTLEPHIQFSQTTPYFVRNFASHAKLPVYFRYLALLGAWNLVTTFGAIGPKLIYLALLWSHTFKRNNVSETDIK